MRLYVVQARRTPSRCCLTELRRDFSSAVTGVLAVFFAGLYPVSAIAQFPIPTTVQLPTFGVAIDAEGLLEAKRFEDRSGRLFLERARAARRAMPGDMFKSSSARKVSLKRLLQAVRESTAKGEEIDNAILHLAGLQRLEYLFCYPDKGDIVMVGPAEGWVDDASGRAIGIASGKPVILLEDVAAAIRAFAPEQEPTRFLGCTIDPDPEGLKRLIEYQRSVPRAVVNRSRSATASEMTKGIRHALGLANIQVFGLPNECHMARVLIEADYRMKRIAIGLEPPPVKMATFIDATTSASSATLQRWWFTPDYDCIKTSSEGLAVQILGQGVQLNSEDKTIAADGKLVDSAAKPSRASRMFTQAFTTKYAQIADASGVYAQMRNVIDLLIASAFLQQENWYRMTELEIDVLLDERLFPIERFPAALSTQCVVNAVWKGRRLLVPAGGGVAIQPLEALSRQRISVDDDGLLSNARSEAFDTGDDRWWWD